MCKLALERLHLGEEKSNAIKTDNYLEAHRIQQQIDLLCLEEKATKDKMVLANGTVGSMSDFSVSSKSPLRSNETSMMEVSLLVARYSYLLRIHFNLFTCDRWKKWI